jgi:hypothetical protein
MLLGQRQDLLAVGQDENVRHDDQAGAGLAHERRYGRIDLGRIVNGGRNDLYLQRGGGGFDRAQEI